MEFLDPKKQRAHTIRLLIGYVLIGIALLLATTILIYQARGFGIKDGQVIENGLVFVSSLPDAADIYSNGQKIRERTNARLTIPAGQYTFELRRAGYRAWHRAINVEGGVVVRFDYPFLVPSKLATAPVKKYDVQPPITLQSPDRRWLLIPRAETFGLFDRFDLKQETVAAEPLQLPPDILAAGAGAHSWQLVEWAADNRHVLVKHLYGQDGKQSEYILLDRQKPEESVNLTTLLGTNNLEVTLHDKAYDSYFIHDTNAANLFTANLKRSTPQLYVQHVGAFKNFGEDRVLYVTAQGAPAGKVLVKLKAGDQTYTLKTISADTAYLLDLAQYRGTLYVAAGAQSEHRTYVFKDPIAALRSKPAQPLVPVQILKTASPNRVSFSTNARFVATENGGAFAVYDIENDRYYKYELKQPVESAAGYASWMDGHRMSMVSGGKLVIFDFDNANQETLQPLHNTYNPAFDGAYRYVYGLTPQTVKAAGGQEVTQWLLTRTALRTASDL